MTAACGGSDQDERPTAAEWRATWDEFIALVPTDVPPEREACESALADLRTDREDVLPSPSESLDVTVTQWVDKAEQLTFDCDEAVYADGLADLDSLGAQIDGGLAGL